MKNKPRLLLVGDYSAGTGFNRVVDHVKIAAARNFEIHQVGINYREKTFIDDQGITIYPYKPQPKDPHGAKKIGKLLQLLQPAIFLIVYDAIFMRFLLEALRYKRNPCKTVVYFALDGLILKQRKIISTLKSVDLCVLYSNFGHDHIQQLLKESPSLMPKYFPMKVIHHGVETSLFYPLNKIAQDPKDRAEFKQKIFPQLEKPEESFIILNGNRPVPRKRLDITLRAFALFAKNKPAGVKLHMHTSFIGGLPQIHLNTLIQELGIEDRILYRGIDPDAPKVDNETLNLIYNACDVGVNTCMGEGWGLVSCEHGATGAPQILPRHTAFPDIWGEVAQWVEPSGTTRVRFSPHLMHQIEIEDVAQAMEILYSDKKLYAQRAVASYERMQELQFNWSHIQDQWQATLLQTLEKPLIPQKTFINP